MNFGTVLLVSSTILPLPPLCLTLIGDNCTTVSSCTTILASDTQRDNIWEAMDSQFPLRLIEHCVLRVVVAYCVASYRQRGKNYQFSQLRNITGSKGRLDIPFLWQSMKLFTTNSCYTTTTLNMQCSNATEIDCTYGTSIVS